MEIQSSIHSNITYRGKWSPDTNYSIGDYVYTDDRIGFYYVALSEGQSQSSTWGISSSEEPAWVLYGFTYDRAIQWTVVELPSDTDFDSISRWQPYTKYNLDDMVLPSSGPIVVHGSDTVYYGFKLNKLIVKPDWPTDYLKTLVDNDITWETRVSYLKLLPKARQTEGIYIELCETMDYLQLHEEVYFNDVIHKFNDRNKVRTQSLEQIVGEYGYTYISNALNLTEKELRALVSYLQMVHAFKGHISGLEMVFELIGMQSYHAEEWWQQEPKGEPHTWALYIQMDIDKSIPNLVQRLITFTRNYVYPILAKLEITYTIDYLKAVIIPAAFIDREYYIPINDVRTFISTSTFIDREYLFPHLEESAIQHPNVLAITSAFIDREYSFNVNNIEESSQMVTSAFMDNIITVIATNTEPSTP